MIEGQALGHIKYIWVHTTQSHVATGHSINGGDRTLSSQRKMVPPGDVITVLLTYEPWFPPGALHSSLQRFRHQFPIHMSPLLLTQPCHVMKGKGEKDGPQKEGRGRRLCGPHVIVA